MVPMAHKRINTITCILLNMDWLGMPMTLPGNVVGAG